MDKLICVIPKNARLKLCRQISLNWLKENKISYSEFLEVRGEDVPLFVEKLIKEGKNAVGVTGEDLFKEWQLQNPSSNLFLIKKEEWKDSTSVQLFGKPTLCLLGPKNKKLEDLNKNLRVCISSKYKNLAKHYLNNLETKGFKFEKIYVAGSAEETFIKGLADLVVDIVYTGESSKNAGLEVYDEIFSSNVVIIGKTENIINKFYLENLAPGQKEKILKRYRFKLENVKKQIEPLIKDVKLRGDDAIIELIKKFDNISLTRAQLKVSKEEI